MRYTVTWTQEAQDALAASWLDAAPDQREYLRHGFDQIDQALRQFASQKGSPLRGSGRYGSMEFAHNQICQSLA